MTYCYLALNCYYMNYPLCMCVYTCVLLKLPILSVISHQIYHLSIKHSKLKIQKTEPVVSRHKKAVLCLDYLTVTIVVVQYFQEYAFCLPLSKRRPHH